MHGTQDLLDLAEQPKGDLPRKLVVSRLRDVMYGRTLRSRTLDAEVADFGCPAALGYWRRRARGRLVESCSGVGWRRRPRQLLERARGSWRCVERWCSLVGAGLIRRRGNISTSSRLRNISPYRSSSSHSPVARRAVCNAGSTAISISAACRIPSASSVPLPTTTYCPYGKRNCLIREMMVMRSRIWGRCRR